MIRWLARYVQARQFTTDRLLPSLLNFLAPPGCCLCQYPLATVMEASASHSLPNLFRPSLCVGCASLLPDRVANLCKICGAPLGPHIQSSEGCHHCRGNRFAFSGVVTLGTYEGELKRMCQLGKLAASQPLVHCLTQQLYEHHQQQLHSWNCSAIVNVPLHWRKRIIRPCHPNERMAACLAFLLGCPFQNNWLQQTKITETQSNLAPRLRRKNVAGAFMAKKSSAIEGARILLVDDILTTGATAQYCSQALLKQGAEAVFVAVLARGLGH